MPAETQEKPSFGTRNFHLMILISQSIGLSSSTVIPSCALKTGALGYLISYILSCIFLGIPLVYMELIIGQFTGLNSLEVWKVRPVLSHVGHALIFWQILILFLNHTIATFVIHYMFVSFENPQPYYVCGPWATRSCDIISKNFTINQDCIRLGPKFEYCDNLYTTYPEIQYYKNLAGYNTRAFRMEWRLCLPSGIACLLLYLSCFKRRRSLQWCLGVLTIYPGVGFIILMLGSLLQKGILMHYQDVMDIDFQRFVTRFKLTDFLLIVIYSMAAGTGLIVNVGASCPFRAPCYANTVLTIAANITFQMLLVCTSGLMACPYSYEHGMSPERITQLPISFLFERVPTMLREYDNNSFWAIITYSSYACLAVRTTIIVYYNLLEIFSKRFSRIAKYPGLVTFGTAVILFIMTMPALGNVMKHLISPSYRRCTQLISVIVVIIEYIVFILCYGLERFCEDVHFMQGIRPSAYMKFAWVVSSALLLYVCFDELWCIVTSNVNLELTVGIWIFGLTVFYMAVLGILKLLASTYKKNARGALRLGAAWKPRSELLQRSRAMFTAQAMTKEYLYRQYHLQAGILERQRRANRTRITTTI